MPLPVRLLFSAVCSGIALGIAGRLAMRFIALESGLPGAFSVGGSLEVVGFGALVGSPAAWAFLLFRRRLKTGAAWPGALFGLLLLASFVVFRPPSASSALSGTPDTPAATVLAFACVLVAWGLSLEVLHRAILRRSRPGDPGYPAS